MFLSFAVPGAYIKIDKAYLRLSIWSHIMLYSAGVANNYLFATICIFLDHLLVYVICDSASNSGFFLSQVRFILWLQSQLNLSNAILNSLPVKGLDGGSICERILTAYTTMSRDNIGHLMLISSLLYTFVVIICFVNSCKL